MLARRVAMGDERAFTTLYERYAARLHAYCWTILRDEAAVQDALQSTWLNALTALRARRRSAPLRPWLFRIAHNESVSIIRRREPAITATVPDAPAPSAEDQALRRENLRQLLADLSALPERSRGALVLRELCGLTHQEIAVTLGTSVGAAKQSILEARRDLHESAAGRETACGEIRRRISDGDRRTLRARVVGAHLRHCAGCTQFAAELQQRRRVLPVLIPPLAPLIADRVLRHVLRSGGGSAAGSAGAGALSGLGATGGGAVTVACKPAVTVVGKVLVGAAVAGVAAVTAGVGVRVLRNPQPHHAHVAAPAQIRPRPSTKAVAMGGPDAALVTTQKAVSDTSARGVPARSRRVQHLKRDVRPPGQAKKATTPTIPPGQAKKTTTPHDPTRTGKENNHPHDPTRTSKENNHPHDPTRTSKENNHPHDPTRTSKENNHPHDPTRTSKENNHPHDPTRTSKENNHPHDPTRTSKENNHPHDPTRTSQENNHPHDPTRTSQENNHRRTIPPGQANQTPTPEVPPGQANQTPTPSAAHVPGQGHEVASDGAHSAK